MQSIVDRQERQQLQVTVFVILNKVVKYIGDYRLEIVPYLYFKFEPALITALKTSIGKMIKAMPHQEQQQEIEVAEPLSTILLSFLEAGKHHPQYIYSIFGVQVFSLLLRYNYLSHMPTKRLLSRALKNIVF